LLCQKDGLAEWLISALAEASNNPPKLTTLKITALNFTLDYDAGSPSWPEPFLGALMHDATSQSSHLKLAIAPGVPSSCFSTLLALQRAEEPNITIAFFETSSDDLVTGLDDGRYDAGMSLRNVSASSLKSQPLWIENIAVAMPLRSPLLAQTKLTIAELLDYPVFRWPAESCSLLDQRLSSLPPLSQQSIQHVTSFEMLALWVGAGYGVGLTAQSRIERADAWGITARPLAEGPYEVVTYLQRPNGRSNAVYERFERRAMQVARSGA
jgi:DNA-binding transcriptional LysR family regulator